MATLKFIGNTALTSVPCSSLEEFYQWLEPQTILGLDTETNVVESILERKLKVIIAASVTGDVVWVIEYEFLPEVVTHNILKELSKRLCIIHNVSFDYSVLKKYGVVFEKVWDTMLAEQVLHNGYSSESTQYGLQATIQRRFDIVISKDEQLTFGEGPYDDNQIKYAAFDTVFLGKLYQIQKSEMKAVDARVKQKGNKGLYKTMWWENEFVKVVADMETTGVRIDKDIWYSIEDSVRPIWEQELNDLNTLAKRDFWDILEANNWISDKDEFVETIWSSSKKKLEILNKVYDFEITKTAVTELKKLLKEHDPDFPEGLKISGKDWANSDYPTKINSKFAILKLLILWKKDNEYITNLLNQFLLTNLKDFCVENGWLRLANQLDFNWGSQKQRLILFQAIIPSLESTGKDVIEDYIGEHEIFSHYLAWSQLNHQMKSFGKRFYDQHVDIDGKHRTRFNQILTTGRLSSVRPNLLNIPRKVEVYRTAFIPDPGFSMIDADYDGQELIVTTAISQEPSWLEYQRKGYDLHSKNAELIFGDDWINATEDGCKFFAKDDNGNPMYKKCKCSGHQDMRDKSKSVSFGSIYGISHVALAFQLKISEDQAKFILKRFFEIAPGIKKMMDKFGAFALEKGYIIEPVFGRIRYFDSWKLAVPAEHGAIERAAFNTPIQSSGSAVLKIAFVLLRRWINHNNLQDKIQLLLPYHDETLAQAVNTDDQKYVTLAKEKVEYYMMLAAKLAGFNIKAGAKAGASWALAH